MRSATVTLDQLMAFGAWRDREKMASVEGWEKAALRHASIWTDNYLNCSNSSLKDLAYFDRERYDASTDLFTTNADNNENLVRVTSSGTTGTPISVQYDRAGWYDYTLHPFERIAIEWPEILPYCRPNYTSVLLCSTKSDPAYKVMLPSLNFSMLERVVLRKSENRELLAALDHYQPPIIYGKPSYLTALASSIATEAPKACIQPKLVLTSGENLYQDVREELEMFFGCRVVDIYASAEGGMIALECPKGHNHMHVMSPWKHLEVLTEDGTIRRSGSGELILSNFANYGTSFLRYRTNDFGVLSESADCGISGHILNEFMGRERPTLKIGSTIVPTKTIEQYFVQNGLREFQIAYGNNHAAGRYILPNGVDSKATNIDLTNFISTIFPDASVSIENVDAIYPLGSKVRRFVEITEET